MAGYILTERRRNVWRLYNNSVQPPLKIDYEDVRSSLITSAASSHPSIAASWASVLLIPNPLRKSIRLGRKKVPKADTNG